MSVTTSARPPIVAVIGATGTGKSQLAVELATRFNGEVINGDAIQLYEGLPIITNKITESEQKGIPHHLIGCIGLNQSTWTVGDFVTKAVKIVEDVHRRGKLPIVVGGTHYYIQSLLFSNLILEKSCYKDSEPFPIFNEPTDVILQRLKEVDPVMADRWHPNERRKIERSLEIFLRTGHRASDLYAVQSSVEQLRSDGENHGSNLRYNPLIFWLHAPKDILNQRLDMRLMKMIDGGLLSEVQTLRNAQLTLENAGELVDKSRGIWVAIGFKEFESYAAKLQELGSAENNVLEALKGTSLERAQLSTRQYAGRQEKWIRTKFINAMARASCSKLLFLLDGADLTRWDENVLQAATGITHLFLTGSELPDPALMSNAARELLTPKTMDLARSPDLWQRRTCDICHVVTVTSTDWEKHMGGRRHQKMAMSQSKARGIIRK